MHKLQSLQIDHLVEAFSKKTVSRHQLVTELKKREGQGWYFALDGNRLPIRSHDFKVVVNIDKTKGKYTESSFPVGDRQMASYPQLTTSHDVIAFSGSARCLHNQAEATNVIRDILAGYSPNTHAILTGGYPNGIPHIAAVTAKELGFKTIAVVPKIIHQTNFASIGRPFFDQVLEVGEDWGDESDTFTALASTIYFIGGGLWTEIEYVMACRKNRDLRFVVGFGGLSEKIAKTNPELLTQSQLTGSTVTVKGHLISAIKPSTIATRSSSEVRSVSRI